MTQIADIVGVHETTVSRAIANKYIQTIERTRAYFNQNFVRPDFRLRHLSVLKHVGPTMLFEDNGFHK